MKKMLEYLLLPHYLVCSTAILTFSCFAQPRATNEQESNSLFDMNIEELMEVELTIANKSTQTIEQAPSIVSVISFQEIQKRGWQNLAQVLSHIPGFMMRDQVSGAKGLVVRGMHAIDGILLMTDGIALNDPLDGNFSFYDMPLAGIEKIEIIRGPGSALYGGNAMLAVINLITTKSTNNDSGMTVDLSFGERHFQAISAVVQHDFTFLSTKLWFNQREQNDGSVLIEHDAVEDLISKNEAKDTFAAIANSNQYRSPQSKYLTAGYNLSLTHGKLAGLALEGVHLHKMQNLGLSRLFAIPESNNLERRDDLHKIALTFNHQLNERWSMSAKTYYSYIYNRVSGQLTRAYERNDDEDFDGISERWPNGKQEVRSYEISGYGGELSNHWKISANSALVAGLVAHHYELGDTTNVSNVTTAINGSPLSINLGQVVDLQDFDPKNNKKTYWINQGVKRNLTAAYLQNEWQLNEQLTATIGIRYDNYSDFGQALSPRAGLVWLLSPSVTLKAIHNKAFKPPSFISLYDETITDRNEFRQFGNPELSSSRIETSEFSINYTPLNNLLLQGVLFSAQTSDEVVFDNNDFRYKNEGSRKTSGVELEIRKIEQRYQLWSHYTYNQAEQGSGTGAPLYPKHQLGVGMSFSYTDEFTLALNYLAHSRARRQTTDLRPPISFSQKLQLSLSYQWNKQLTLGLNAANALNAYSRSPVDVTRASALPDDIPDQGRQIALFMTLTY